MNKDEAKERLAAIESEAAKLLEIINKSDAEPKAGEVWQHRDCFRLFLYTRDDEHVELTSLTCPDNEIELYGNDFCDFHAGTRLGTFSDVFVMRSKLSDEYVSKAEMKRKVDEIIKAGEKEDAHYNGYRVLWSILLQLSKELS